MTVSRKTIVEVTREIAQQFHPQKVILCGSYAYGTPTEDSDVDFLIIMDKGKRNLRQALEISRAISHPFPMDIIVLKPEQLSERLEGGDMTLRQMLNQGEVLYEASS